MRLGSLFSGAGGLDLAVEAHTGAETVWQCEQDPDASKVLAARFGVPNLGDITTVDWTEVEPVDVLCGGFPCQDISNAGKRAGITGARSGLWSFYADAVRVLRPRYVYVENVGALVVRGLGTVLGDLAALGYDASWGCVRASDAGAPHRRERVFIVATDTDGAGRQGRGRPVESPRELAAATGHLSADAGVKLLPTPTVGDSRNSRQSTAPNPRDPYDTLSDVAYKASWGDYAAAIARWEPIIDRPAPEPVDGKGRLSPIFVEWLMGWPAGWVTDLDIKRTAQLRIGGNGVVPQQAELAYGLLEQLEAA